MTSAIALPILLALSAAGAAAAPSSADPSTTLDLRVEPAVDLYFTVRTLAAGDAAPPPEMAEAVAGARSVGAALPAPRLWALVDGMALEGRTAAELAAPLDRFPGTFVASTGDTLRIGREVRALGEALAGVEPWFLAQLWPGHRKRLTEARDDLGRTLAAHQAACYPAVTRDLDMPDPGRPVPVYLVAEAPPPGGVTVRRRDGAAAVVAVEDFTGSTLAEVVLHESIHVLDVETAGEPTVLNRVRAGLLEAGAARSRPRYRDLPHALIFVEAAEVVRRILDPAHRDYGETHGAYDRMKDAIRIVRPAWRGRLDGTIDADEAVRRIAAAAGPSGSPPRKPEK